MMKYLKVILFTFPLLLNSSFADLLYSQPFYNATTDKPMQEYGWTTLNETTTGVVENATFTNRLAIGVGRGNGAPLVDPVNATWPGGFTTPRLGGYPFFSTSHAEFADYPTDSSCLTYYATNGFLAIDDLGKLSLHQRADNTDSIIRFAIKIGTQWYASAEEFGGSNTGWILKEMEESDFTDASKWVEIEITATEINLGANPASALTGNIDAFGVFVNTGITPTPGDHARLDNFQVYDKDVTAYYVATIPTDWTDSAAWSDGLAANTGTIYYATNSVVLETPASTASFPGISLNLSAPQRMEVMASGADVITITNLTMDAADLAAGVVDAGEAKIDGTIEVASSSMFSGATDNSRDLRILSLVSGASSVELSAPAHTIFIDNTNNTFNGTWVVSGGTGEFTDEDAIGLANIEVGSNGTLRINGDWDGFGNGDSLTVADSPNALVDLGTNAWSVSSLVIGTSNVPEFITYTASGLNAIAANPVFAGSGTLHVGAPPQPELLVGWERWVGGTNALCPATIETNGITGVATNGGFDLSSYGGCLDGTFGSLLWPPADTAKDEAEDGLRKIGATSIYFDFEVENTTGTGVELNAFHFDALLKGAIAAGTGPQKWNLQVLSGDLTIGGVATNDLDYIGATFDQADYDVDLTGLADHTLDAGGSVAFRLTFTDGVAGNTKFLDMDNVAITKVLVTTPTEPPVIDWVVSAGDMIISWTENGFKLQTRPDLVVGDWVDYPGGSSSPVTVPMTNDIEFLRLVWP